MTDTSGFASDKALRPNFVPARQKHIYSLYCHYARTDAYPFFVDIAGPSPRMNFTQFVEYCTEDEANLSVLLSDKEIGGFILVSDIQSDLELANLDFCFFDGYPGPDSPDAHSLKTALTRIMVHHGVTRLQMLVLENEKSKIELLTWMKFEIEGALREHFYFQGRHHNLVVVSRTEPSRHDL